MNSTETLAASSVALPGFRELFSDYIAHWHPLAGCPTDKVHVTASSGGDCESQVDVISQDSPTNSPFTQFFFQQSVYRILERDPWCSSNSQERLYPSGSHALKTLEARPKNHVCTVCTRAFHRPSSLATHMNSHTGARPHSCPFPNCMRSYGSKSNMQRHYRNAHTPNVRPG